MSSTEDLVAGPLGIGGGSRRSTWRPTSGRTRVRADGEAAPGDHPRALPPGADAGRDAGAPRPDRHGDLAAKAPEWRTVRLPPSPPLRSTSGPVQGRHLAAAEACGLAGNALLIGEGPEDDIRVGFVGLYYRGQRRRDLEREYLEVYHPIDERVPRLRQQPYGRLVHVSDQYTAGELKTSRAYNEALVRAQHTNGLDMRLEGLAGSYMTWCIGDPIASGDWGSSQIVGWGRRPLVALVPTLRACC